ncbi:MAG: folylpolyglutamate synthase/dihydrofolate synthase family protein [Bacillota bacterium]
MFNNLAEAIAWIEIQVKFKPKIDLIRMRSAYAMLGINLDHIKKIHVAGTNGKGSVCAYLSNILIEAGYKVGTFTSPYLLKFHERIRYQFLEIKDDELFLLIERIYLFNQDFTESYGENLSFFELLTLMSLLYFSDKAVDVILMEVGLGGLFDATNILDYDLSIITSIGFDHMKQLGNSLESIALNKLGILKPKNHLITSVEPALHPYFKDYLKNMDVTSEFYTLDDIKKRNDLPLIFKFDQHTYELPLIGEFQLLNGLVSVQAIRYLYPDISYQTIYKGLLQTKWAGRLERIENNIFIDAGHNTHAMDALRRSAEQTFKKKKIWVLFSALGDKDIDGMLKIVKTFAQRIILTEFPDPRFQDLSRFVTKKIIRMDDALTAINKLEKMMDKDTVLIITGSLHFVGYIKSNYVNQSN